MSSAPPSAEMNGSPRPRVAFLGPLGTYSHQAATEFFGEECELLPQPTIADVFTTVSSTFSSPSPSSPSPSSTPTYGLVPIENSSFGPVLETSQQLRTTQLSVRGMVALRVGHALLGSKEQKGETGGVKRVYSHEQAIGQCSLYLSRHYPLASIHPVASTALAAQKAAQDPEALAICSLKCAEVYDLAVVDTDIQDAGTANTTRFIALSLFSVPLPPYYPVSRSKVLDPRRAAGAEEQQ